MKIVSFYHKDTGLLNSVQFMCSDDADLVLNTPKNHAVIDGHHDSLCKKVDIESKTVVDYQPLQPSENHEWNNFTKRWVHTKEYQVRLEKRNAAAFQISMLECRQPRILRKIALQAEGWMTYKSELIEIENQITELEKDL